MDEESRRAAALACYMRGGVSIGYCAEMAGMAKEPFIKYLGENHVSIFQFDSKDEFLEELAAAGDFG